MSETIGGERVVVPEELRRLSEAATQGQWRLGRPGDKTQRHVVSMGEPYMVLSEDGGMGPFSDEWFVSGICHSDSGSFAANAAFIVALVNWFRDISSSDASPLVESEGDRICREMAEKQDADDVSKERNYAALADLIRRGLKDYGTHMHFMNLSRLGWWMCLQAVEASIAGGAAAPEGFRLVPEGPTEGMLRAGLDAAPLWPMPEMAHRSGRASMTDDQAFAIYRAMLEVAPSPDPHVKRGSEGEAEGWRPANTAPTNVAVQVYIPHLDYYGNAGVYAGMLVDMGTGQHWMTFAWAMGRDMIGENAPTHWRPLPAPPSVPA